MLVELISLVKKFCPGFGELSSLQAHLLLGTRRWSLLSVRNCFCKSLLVKSFWLIVLNYRTSLGIVP